MDRIIRDVTPMKLTEHKTLRVAAYARVSCDKDAMRQSLAAQISYYKTYILARPDWEFAGVYADEAYSGTKDDRPEFVRLMEDCRAGEVGRVITKSISRFARNTVTLLAAVRELRHLGVGVYFEEQNIDTLSETGELMITLLASQAQEESRAASENCKWRIRKMFQEGYTLHFNMICYKASQGLVTITPEETELIRRIYQLYLDGYGKQAIANILHEENVPTCLNGEWCSSTITNILRNEKYAGDLLLQKSFIQDHITKRKRQNRGEMPKHFIKNDHEAIIPREMFQAVQEEAEYRARKFAPPRGEFSELTSLIRCGVCGKNYRRKKAHARILWSCATYIKRGKKYCASRSIPELTIRDACCQALGLARYDPQAVRDGILQIEAMPDNALIFHLKDGTAHTIPWVFPSRSESWTEEKRRKASETIRRHYAKQK